MPPEPRPPCPARSWPCFREQLDEACGALSSEALCTSGPSHLYWMQSGSKGIVLLISLAVRNALAPVLVKPKSRNIGKGRPGRTPLVQPATAALRAAVWKWVSEGAGAEAATSVAMVPEKAMCSLSMAWGWRRWVCATLICFYGCCRIGEVLRALRSDLLLPRDLLLDDHRCFRRLEPKTRGCGARVQHTTLELPPHICIFIHDICYGLPRSAGLYYGSHSVYRRRWDRLLLVLGIAQTFHLTPGSLRGRSSGGLSSRHFYCVPTVEDAVAAPGDPGFLPTGSCSRFYPAFFTTARQEAIEAAGAVFPFFFVPAQRSTCTALRASPDS